jgi:effector-binding domain-containing protein
MTKKIFWAALPLVLILSVIYYFLGGFNTIEIQVVDAENYVIAGKSYRGSYQEDLLKDYFSQMKAHVDRDQLRGTVSVVNYGLEYGSTDSVNQLIGVLMDTPFSPVPEHIEVDTLMAQKVVRAIVHAHPVVMPRPDQVIDKIKSFAKEHKLTLREYVIEQYIEEDKIWVDVPLVQDIR